MALDGLGWTWMALEGPGWPLHGHWMDFVSMAFDGRGWRRQWICPGLLWMAVGGLGWPWIATDGRGSALDGGYWHVYIQSAKLALDGELPVWGLPQDEWTQIDPDGWMAGCWMDGWMDGWVKTGGGNFID